MDLTYIIRFQLILYYYLIYITKSLHTYVRIGYDIRIGDIIHNNYCLRLIPNRLLLLLYVDQIIFTT